MKWPPDVDKCDFRLSLEVKLNFLEPPEDMEESVKREQMQNHLSYLCYQFINDQKNQQNLMNVVLGNTGILVP